MRLYLLIFIISLSLKGYSQSTFAKIDKHSREVPSSKEKDPKTLAAYLAEPAANDLEKVRAFYIWIADNIRYDIQAYMAGDESKVLPEDVLRKKKTVCQGYSELMKALCNEAGISCFVIAGYSKGYGYNSRKPLVKADHAWNAVRIDGKWYLLDATWGAGVINEKQKYIKQLNTYYFLTPPRKFIYNHLPADPMWQLLDCPITLDQYKLDSLEIAEVIKPEKCYSYTDSIAAYSLLSSEMQDLWTGEKALSYNPLSTDLLGFAYINYAFSLQVNQPDPNKDPEAFLKFQKQVLALNEKALEYLSKSRSDRARQGVQVCRENIKIIKDNIKQLEKMMKH